MKITLKKYNKKKLHTNIIIILYYPKKGELFIHSFKQESYKIHNLKIRYLYHK